MWLSGNSFADRGLDALSALMSKRAFPGELSVYIYGNKFSRAALEKLRAIWKAQAGGHERNICLNSNWIHDGKFIPLFYTAEETGLHVLYYGPSEFDFGDPK